jgi:UDP-GlcNAc:undecaprenyl-phosphate GlcNAc-1-phosphate transferase
MIILSVWKSDRADVSAQIAIAFLYALILSVALTPAIRWAAVRYGYVALPRKDRWHHTPTALFGGIAIYLAFIIPFGILHDFDLSMLYLLAGATIVFALGAWDDHSRVQPYTKLVVQIGAASLATFGAFLPYPSIAFPLILIPLAICGLVTLTNAFNLLDNMDGLSAGIACITSFFLFIISFTLGNWSAALCAVILCGATLGFLFYNFNPASIFMGDSGSMFLGFLIAALTIKGNWEPSTAAGIAQGANLLLMVLIPLLVLAVPIFDTTFVTLVRWMNGRAISQGGRDHTSHRLVAFGLTERKTVLLFYLISIACGFIAYLGVLYNALLLSLLGTLAVIGIAYFGMVLSGVVVYGTEKETQVQAARGRGVVLDIFLMHKRRILEVIVDVVLICFAYTLSFGIRFEGNIPVEHFRILAQTLPLIIPLKLFIFSSFGLYRGVWRYVSMQDLIAILKAVTLSSILAIATMTMLFRFELLPRTVFVIDWMALLLLVAGVRVLANVIRESLVRLSDTKGKRMVIIGAGDAGELVARELQNNAMLGYVPLGFFDDDPEKQGRRIRGIPVLGGRDKIVEIVSRLRVDEIIVALPSASPDVQATIMNICQSTGLPVTVMPSLIDMIRGLVPASIPSVRIPQRTSELGKEPTWN